MKTLIGALVIATMSRILADDAKEWMPWLSAKLIHWAARHLPDSERREEEWLAHCNDLPGNIAKLWHATGCVIVYLQCSNALQKAAWCLFIYPIVELSFALALVLTIVLEITGSSLLDNFDPEFARLRRLRRNAGGLRVLGINDLSLRPEDCTIQDRLRTMGKQVFASILDEKWAPDFSRALINHRRRLTRRVLKWLFRGLTDFEF